MIFIFWMLSFKPTFSLSSFTFIKMLSNHLILCCPLLLLPSIFPSIRVFSKELASHQMAKVLGFQLQHQSFQWIFRTDFLQDGLLDLAVQRTLKSLLRHQNLNALFLWHLAIIIQLSHLYMTTGKTIALTIHIFVSKVISLLSNMLSRFIKAFLPRSKCLNFMTAATV